MKYLLVLALMVLPIAAAHRLGVAYHWAGVYMALLSGIAYGVYAVDKRRAEAGQWRVPEAQLHLLELLGGWPGVLLAQRRLRHKCAKVGYQVVFWLIVLAWQLAAGDSFQQWRFTHAALNYLQRTVADR